jgi:hypothetical protein
LRGQADQSRQTTRISFAALLRIADDDRHVLFDASSRPGAFARLAVVPISTRRRRFSAGSGSTASGRRMRPGDACGPARHPAEVRRPRVVSVVRQRRLPGGRRRVGRRRLPAAGRRRPGYRVHTGPNGCGGPDTPASNIASALLQDLQLECETRRVARLRTGCSHWLTIRACRPWTSPPRPASSTAARAPHCSRRARRLPRRRQPHPSRYPTGPMSIGPSRRQPSPRRGRTGHRLRHDRGLRG